MVIMCTSSIASTQHHPWIFLREVLPKSVHVWPLLRVSFSSTYLTCLAWLSNVSLLFASSRRRRFVVSMSAWGSCVVGVPLLCAKQQHAASWVPSVLWDLEAHHGAWSCCGLRREGKILARGRNILCRFFSAAFSSLLSWSRDSCAPFSPCPTAYPHGPSYRSWSLSGNWVGYYRELTQPNLHFLGRMSFLPVQQIANAVLLLFPQR